jgi:hypothetical protein
MENGRLALGFNLYAVTRYLSRRPLSPHRDYRRDLEWVRGQDIANKTWPRHG